jgi:predicted phosphodiesterase
MKSFKTLLLAIILGLSACATPVVPEVTEQVEVVATATTAEVAVPSATVVVPTAPVQPLATATPIAIDALSEVGYALPLVVQHVGETSAVMFFELAQAAEGVLVVRPVEGTDQHVIALDGTQTRQQIVVEGLQAGLVYEAQVGLGVEGAYAQPVYAERAWGPVQFTTQSDAPASQEAPLRVGVIGDSGFGEEITYQMAGLMARQDLDFVVHTGDAVYQIYNNESAVEAYQQKWYSPFEAVLKQMPIYPVVGNHDVEESAQVDGVPFYYSAFPAFGNSAFEGRNQWYAVGYGEWQFLMLDTQTFFGEAGRAEQDAWLAERLADPQYAHTIPVFHVTAYSSGNTHQYDGSPVQEWVPLFEAANVPLVISGHSHNYERLLVGAVTYLVSGGGSSSLYGQGDPIAESQMFAAKSHFVVLAIYGDRIEIQAISAAGEIIDQLSLRVE